MFNRLIIETFVLARGILSLLKVHYSFIQLIVHFLFFRLCKAEEVLS